LGQNAEWQRIDATDRKEKGMSPNARVLEANTGQAMDLGAVSLTSVRLSLRSFAPADAPEIFAAVTPTLTRYMGWDPAPSPHAFEEIWRAWLPAMAEGSEGHFVVRLGGSREFLGMAGLHHVGSAEPEVGIWVAEAKHGNGYGREAVAALVSFASSGLGKEAVVYPVAAANGPSRRLAESLGGEIVAKRVLRKDGGVEYPEVVYRIPCPAFSGR
jgi:RimJ/RimL family protein N-acetyltransferase